MRRHSPDTTDEAPIKEPVWVPRADRPSKTSLKKQSHDLQALGQQLAELSNERFAALAMPESLRDAIVELKRTRSHEGRRRQLQLVGKLMRGVDGEPLREAVAASKLGSTKESLLLHETERWRDALLAQDDALTEFMHLNPSADSQALRNLVRAARRDAQKPVDQRNPRAARELFQQLRPMVAGQLAAILNPTAQTDTPDE
jgi:ribosome-associated protein